MFNKLKAAVTLLWIVVTFSGCGGGSGGTTGTNGGSTVTSTTTSTLAVSTIVTSVTAANYAGGSFKQQYYNYLNSQRQSCGFGLLQQESHLDTAAQNHATWMETNGQVVHVENQSSYPTGFTGVNPWDRGTAAGYTWVTYGEVLSVISNKYGTTLGQAGAMDLFLAPYHGMGQLLGWRDIGIGEVDVPANGGFPESEWYNVNFGTTAARGTQLLDSITVATYPCNGVTGVLSKSYNNELPAPIPGRDLSSNPIGQPIYIKVRDGQNLALNAYTLKQVGINTALPLLLLNHSNDTNAEIPDNSVAILMPNAPLATNTSYQFTATGTNNGQAVSINFTFTTGAF